MRQYKVLTWHTEGSAAAAWLYKLFKLLENSRQYDIIVKDRSEFGFPADYASQQDFDRVCGLYQPDVVVLHIRSANNLSVRIPDHIYAITYLDMFIESFCMLGEKFFKCLQKNNYIILPILNAERIDPYHILSNEAYKEKIIPCPFAAFLDDHVEPCKDIEKYQCDVSLVSYKKGFGFYKWVFDLNSNVTAAKALMQMVCLVSTEVRKEILERECAVLDMSWIETLLKKYFDRLNIWQYARNKEQLLEYWKKAVYYNIVYVEFGNCVADWMMESGYRVKLWGSGWEEEEKYKGCAMGVLPENGNGLCYARQYSKIAIDNHFTEGIHRRTFENIYYGSLEMMAYPGDGLQYSDYRNYFIEDESIVLFRNKKELLHKIDYYMSHEQERKKIIRNGQNILKEKKLDTFHIMEAFWSEFLRRIGV